MTQAPWHLSLAALHTVRAPGKGNFSPPETKKLVDLSGAVPASFLLLHSLFPPGISMNHCYRCWKPSNYSGDKFLVWTRMWSDNHSWHQYQRNAHFYSKWSFPLRLGHGGIREENLFLPHQLAVNEKRKEQKHTALVWHEVSSHPRSQLKLDCCSFEGTVLCSLVWSLQSSVNFLLKWHVASNSILLHPRFTSSAPSSRIYGEFRFLHKLVM